MSRSVVLKECVWRRDGASLIVMFDPAQTVRLADAAGQVERLLAVLATGPQPVDRVRQLLVAESVIGPDDTLEGPLGVLDRLGFLEDGAGHRLASPAEERRQAANLAFFSSFSSLATGRAVFVERLRCAHVLQLGLGGVGSATVQALCGLGIGRLTLLDHDSVAQENLNRQVLYRHEDVGSRKTERAAAWVRACDPSIEVNTVDRRVVAPVDVVDLLSGVDVVVVSIDEPPQVWLAVNAAAMPRGVPLVRGGVSPFEVRYSSVDPGRSACLTCIDHAVGERLPGERRAVELDLVSRLPRANGSTAPMAGIAGSLIALEVARFLTGFQAPQAAGAVVSMDLRDGFTPRVDRFDRVPSCPDCDAGAAGHG